MHQHVFSFEGIRARESILSAHPPSPSICLSLSLSRSKGRRAKGQFNFFPQFKFGKLGEKREGEKRTEMDAKGQSSERFFFVLDEFWDDAFLLLCVKWRRRPSKNMSTMRSLARSFAIKTDACSHSLSFKTIHRDALWSNHQRNRRKLRVRGQTIFVVVCLPRVLYASRIRDVMRRVGEI